METGESPDICWPTSLAYAEENKKDPATKKKEDKAQHSRLLYMYTETEGVMSVHTQLLKKEKKEKKEEKAD